MLRALSLILSLTIATAAQGQAVVIGTADTYPPMIIHDGTPPVGGLEGEVVAQICARAGWTCTWEIMPFDTLFSALEAGRVDIAAASLGYTAERAARVHMTCPYRPSGEDSLDGTFYVRDPGHDPRSDEITVLRGTLHATALAEAGLSARLFSTDAAALDAVIAGEVPAYFGPDPTVETHPGRTRLTAAGGLAIRSGGTSLAVTPLRRDIADAVDTHLAALSREGILTSLTLRSLGQGVDDPIALCDITPPIS